MGAVITEQLMKRGVCKVIQHREREVKSSSHDLLDIAWRLVSSKFAECRVRILKG